VVFLQAPRRPEFYIPFSGSGLVSYTSIIVMVYYYLLWGNCLSDTFYDIDLLLVDELF
jgi:hypothetical protein